MLNRERWEQARAAVQDCLLRRLNGIQRRNGYVASLCPYPHVHDRPGRHFNWEPRSGTGRCFGRQGRIELFDLCCLLGARLGA
jgi:hypothetical protein